MVSSESKEALLEHLKECSNNLELFCKSFFPDRFTLPFSPNIHKKMFEILDNDEYQRVAIAAPRGVGKTTLTNIVIPAREILFKKRNYVIPISCTADSAVEQGENLKKELETNENILRVFGSLKSGNWSKETWDTAYGTRVKPRGAEQQVRGRLYGRHRPDLIIIDDLEDPNNMDNEEQRKKKKLWFLADVMNSINRYEKGWRIIVVGTVLHEDSLLVNLLDNPNWKTLTLEICDDNFESNWKEGISNAECKTLYDDLAEQGEADVFFREYRNMPVPSGKDATFTKDMFKRYDESDLKLYNNREVENIVLCDPAKTSTLQSADSAIVVWGVNVYENRYYIRDIVRGKMRPNEIFNNTIDLAIRYKAKLIGIETTGLEDHVLHPLKNEIARRGVFFHVVSLKARRGKGEYAKRGKGKEGRVAGLVDPYKRGQIWHNRAIAHLIEGQLLSFPKAKLWDVMDCAAYLLEVLEQHFVYFAPDDYTEDPEEVENEYADLDEERILAPLEHSNWI